MAATTSQPTIWGRMRAAFKAFREAIFASGEKHAETFDEFEARRTRYDILWSYYESSTYRAFLHTWTEKYLKDYGLYKYVRNIYDPAYRLAEFWVSALVGGILDSGAGDKGALPIALPETMEKTNGENLRLVLAQIHTDSNWQVNKSIWARYGVVKGDTALRAVDDVARQKSYLEVIRPDILKSVTRDSSGNVKAYEIEQVRKHPQTGVEVTYTEICENIGGQGLGDGEQKTDDANAPGGQGTIRFKTLMNGEPYAWNGVAAEWTENYGFVPLVVTKHIDVGLEWGWAELLPALAKLREADDQWSVVDDHIRVKHKSPWLFNFKKPDAKPRVATDTDAPSTETPQPGREDLNALYIPQENAKGQALVADLQIDSALNNLDKIISQIEKDFPEIRDELYKVGGQDASGKALRILREPVEMRVNERRAVYDNALVRAQMMCISIGAQKSYPGFEKFSAESFNDGKLAHSIAPRPVFRQDPLDELELETSLWKAAEQAQKVGVAVEVFLELRGWDQDKIAKVTGSAEFQARRKMIVSSADALDKANQNQDEGA